MLSNVNVVHSIASLALTDGGPSYTVSSLASAQQVLTSGSVQILSGRLEHGKDVMPNSYVRVYGINKPWPYSLFATRAKLAELLKTPHTVLHDQGIWHPHNFAATGLAAKRHLPYVISTHGMLEPWTLQYHATRKRIAKWLYQDRLLEGASCLIANSAAEVRSIRAAGFRNPVAMIPNGIDSEIPDLKPRANFEKRTMLFLSRIHPKKGLIHAIEAWNVLRPKDWMLKIVGPSENDHRHELESLVHRCSLNDSIQFFDSVSGVDKYQCYYDADIFLLPSHSENFGIVVAEALACGLPVITTTGTPWHELHHRDCGWYIETGTDSLIAALRQAFATDPNRLKEMGRRGQQWIRAEFTWPEIAAQNMMIYEWILRRKPRPKFVDMHAI